MRALMAAIFTVAMANATAQELTRNLTVKELLQICSDESRRSICSSFIAGVVNTVDYFNSKHRIENGFKPGDGFCILAKNPSQQEIESSVLTSLRKNQNQNLGIMTTGALLASTGVYFAMIETYPCNENNLF